MSTSPTAVVCAAVEQLQAQFFEPLSAAELLRAAWEGWVAVLARAGVSPLPPPPDYPDDPSAAYALHAQTFAALQALRPALPERRRRCPPLEPAQDGSFTLPAALGAET